MRTIDATYDTTDTGDFVPVEPGVYPAHVSDVISREIQVRGEPAVVFDLKYKIAEEASELEQTIYEMDGYDYKTDSDGDRIKVMNGDGSPKKVNCNHVVGREYRGRGCFLFTGTENSSKNKRYFQLLDVLGVKTEEIEQDGRMVKKLPLVEKDDVSGRPVQVELKLDSFITKDTKHLPESQQSKKFVWKAWNVHPWNDGPVLSEEEMDTDIPF